jgi:hypothetical protein
MNFQGTGRHNPNKEVSQMEQLVEHTEQELLLQRLEDMLEATAKVDRLVRAVGDLKHETTQLERQLRIVKCQMEEDI